jgi:hypothetical protein
LANGLTQCAPGCFWSEYLQGDHTSTDCLVLAGKVLWFAHTQGAATKDKQRPIYWHIGVRLPALEPLLRDLIQAQLPGYTGLCNVEMIGGKVIEMHLRGSNGFFDFYGAHFVPAWVELVDKRVWHGLESVRTGYVYSLFGTDPLPANHANIAAKQSVTVVPDTATADRSAILYADKITPSMRAALDETACVPVTPPVHDSPELKRCAGAFRRLTVELVAQAARAANLRRLIEEYRRTERRARALENVLLPEIDRSLRFIEEQLDAVDQEEAVRVRNAARAH